MPGLSILNRMPGRARAVLMALLVTFLWSTSWVLIKLGLEEVPAVTFAGLRYGLAFLLLLPFAMQPGQRQAFRRLSRRDWFSLALLGVLYYAVTQGTQFAGLALLPATNVSLLLNFTPVIVMGLGAVLLKEKPTWLQAAGVAINVSGILLYFGLVPLSGSQVTGLLVVAAGVLTNAISSVLGRSINRERRLSAMLVTTVSMGIGAALLLASGLAFQGLPRLSLSAWAMIGWLALVNTAFAFTLWNHALRDLTAMEASIINGTMLVQIAILAVIFLSELLNWQQTAGLALVAAGALLVQVRFGRVAR